MRRRRLLDGQTRRALRQPQQQDGEALVRCTLTSEPAPVARRSERAEFQGGRCAGALGGSLRFSSPSPSCSPRMAALQAQLAADELSSAPLVAPSMSAANSSNRSMSHGRRSHSLSEGHHSSPGSNAPNTAGTAAGTAANGSAATGATDGWAQDSAAAVNGNTPALTRRNNTVSTASSSRLVRLERNRARLAL